MKKKFLKVFVTCLGLFIAIDGWINIAFNFDCINALLKMLGISSGIKGVPKWILIVACVAVWMLIIKYDMIFDYAFRSSDDASITKKIKNN